MYDNPFLPIMPIIIADIAMLGALLACKTFGGSESSEDEQLTPERHVNTCLTNIKLK